MRLSDLRPGDWVSLAERARYIPIQELGTGRIVDQVPTVQKRFRGKVTQNGSGVLEIFDDIFKEPVYVTHGFFYVREVIFVVP